MRPALRVLAATLLATSLAACAHPLAPGLTRSAQPLTVKQARGLAVELLKPAAIPANVLGPVQTAAQQAADDASRRRKIDFFALFNNPLALRIGSGEGAGYVFSFLGTSKQNKDLNVELRATLGGGQFGCSLNYSGPETLGLVKSAQRLKLGAAPDAVTFELLTGLPGDGVSDAYADYLDHFGQYLVDRYQAQPFQFDDGPLIFAVHQGDAVVGYLFTNQGNRLVLGDRKYADVQSVVLMSPEAEVLKAYTLVGFNPKTSALDKPPVYHYDEDDRFGTVVQFGKL